MLLWKKRGSESECNIIDQSERRGDICTPARIGVCAAGAKKQEEAGGSQEEKEGESPTPLTYYWAATCPF